MMRRYRQVPHEVEREVSVVTCDTPWRLQCLSNCFEECDRQVPCSYVGAVLRGDAGVLRAGPEVHTARQQQS
jgi:hypothetical protein